MQAFEQENFTNFMNYKDYYLEKLGVDKNISPNNISPDIITDIAKQYIEDNMISIEECMDYQFEEIDDDNVYINTSNIPGSGDGLFAKKSFKKGEIVTGYPFSLLYDTNPKLIEGCRTMIKGFDEEKFVNLGRMKQDEYTWRIMIGFGKFLGIFVPGLGVEIKNKKFMGHLVNDNGYMPNEKYKNDVQNCDPVSYNYDPVKKKIENKMILRYCANRDIQMGEELYGAYGRDYWFNADSDTGISRNETIIEKLNSN
tara:strand:- start:1081 stop:1845 length:765 start_codon:yes stop_codon:yes gene_type:complete